MEKIGRGGERIEKSQTIWNCTIKFKIQNIYTHCVLFSQFRMSLSNELFRNVFSIFTYTCGFSFKLISCHQGTPEMRCHFIMDYMSLYSFLDFLLCFIHLSNRAAFPLYPHTKLIFPPKFLDLYLNFIMSLCTLKIQLLYLVVENFKEKYHKIVNSLSVSWTLFTPHFKILGITVHSQSSGSVGLALCDDMPCLQLLAGMFLKRKVLPHQKSQSCWSTVCPGKATKFPVFFPSESLQNNELAVLFSRGVFY